MDALDQEIQQMSATEAFYSRVCQFLLMVKLVHGGNGLRAYFMKHKNIYKYLCAKLHTDSIDIDNLFDILVSSSNSNANKENQ